MVLGQAQKCGRVKLTDNSPHPLDLYFLITITMNTFFLPIAMICVILINGEISVQILSPGIYRKTLIKLQYTYQYIYRSFFNAQNLKTQLLYNKDLVDQSTNQLELEILRCFNTIFIIIFTQIRIILYYLSIVTVRYHKKIIPCNQH